MAQEGQEQHENRRQPGAEKSAEMLAEVISHVTGALTRLDYGTVVITVHAAKVVQIDVTERQRFAT